MERHEWGKRYMIEIQQWQAMDKVREIVNAFILKDDGLASKKFQSLESSHHAKIAEANTALWASKLWSCSLAPWNNAGIANKNSSFSNS